MDLKIFSNKKYKNTKPRYTTLSQLFKHNKTIITFEEIKLHYFLKLKIFKNNNLLLHISITKYNLYLLRYEHKYKNC